MKRKCMCGPCVKKRESNRRWVEKNRATVNAKNNTFRKKWRAKIKASTAEVSDEQMDRLALAMGGGR